MKNCMTQSTNDSYYEKQEKSFIVMQDMAIICAKPKSIHSTSDTLMLQQPNKISFSYYSIQWWNNSSILKIAATYLWLGSFFFQSWTSLLLCSLEACHFSLLRPEGRHNRVNMFHWLKSFSPLKFHKLRLDQCPWMQVIGFVSQEVAIVDWVKLTFE